MANNHINFKGRNISTGKLTQASGGSSQGYYLFVRFVKQARPVTPKHTTPVFVRIAPNWANNLRANGDVSGLCVECVGCFRKYFMNLKRTVTPAYQEIDLDILGIYNTLEDCRKGTNPLNDENSAGGGGGGGGVVDPFIVVYLTEIRPDRNEILTQFWENQEAKWYPTPQALINRFPTNNGLIGCDAGLVLLSHNSIAQAFLTFSDVSIRSPIGTTVYIDRNTYETWTVDDTYPHIKWDWITRFNALTSVRYRYTGSTYGYGWHSFMLTGLQSEVNTIVDDIHQRIPGLQSVNVNCATSGGGTAQPLAYPRAWENGGDNEPGETFIHVPLSKYKAEIWAGFLNSEIEPIKLHETTADELLAMMPFFTANGAISSRWTGMTSATGLGENAIFKAHNLIDIILSESIYEEAFDTPGRTSNNSVEEYRLADSNIDIISGGAGINTSYTSTSSAGILTTSFFVGDPRFAMDCAINSFRAGDDIYVIIKEGVIIPSGFENLGYLPITAISVDEQVVQYRDFYRINKHIIIKIENFKTVSKQEVNEYPADFLEIARLNDVYFYRFAYKHYFAITFRPGTTFGFGYIHTFVDIPGEKNNNLKNPYIIPDITVKVQNIYSFNEADRIRSWASSRLVLKHQRTGSYIVYDFVDPNSEITKRTAHKYLFTVNVNSIWAAGYQKFIFPKNKFENLYYRPIAFGIPASHYEKYAFVYASQRSSFDLERDLTNVRSITKNDILSAAGISQEDINTKYGSSINLKKMTYPEIYKGLSLLLSEDDLKVAMLPISSVFNAYGHDLTTHTNLQLPIFDSYWIPVYDSRNFMLNYTEKSITRTETQSQIESTLGELRQVWNFVWFLICQKIPIYIMLSVDKYNTDGYKILQDPLYFQKSFNYFASDATTIGTDSYNFEQVFKPIYSNREIIDTKIVKFDYPLPLSENMIYQQSYFLGFFGGINLNL